MAVWHAVKRGSPGSCWSACKKKAGLGMPCPELGSAQSKWSERACLSVGLPCQDLVVLKPNGVNAFVSLWACRARTLLR
eukprot:1160940-Pelagomonas_calceolata.AAC.7